MTSDPVLAVLRRPRSDYDLTEEGLRVAVGLTTANPDVTVLLLDGAAWLATLPASAVEGQHGLELHWETLSVLGIRRLVERESLAMIGLESSSVIEGVEVVERAAVAELITAFPSVLVY
ncbi:MAG: DsrE family protein [Chloroflexota bacterium]